MTTLTRISEMAGSSLGDRLRSAYRCRVVHPGGAAERLKGRIDLGHATLASYERGTTKPGMDVVAAIAREVDRPLNGSFRPARRCGTCGTGIGSRW